MEVSMPISIESIEQRIAQLRADIVEQGRRVEQMVQTAVESVFDRDADKASWVIKHDEVIDRADVEIERAAVDLLTVIAHNAVDLPPRDLRRLLMIVKVNNELERIADNATLTAEQVEVFAQLPCRLSNRFRVMANSVIGVVRDTATCLEREDLEFSQTVLASDDTIDEFERAILHEMQQGVADGEVGVEFAFATNIMANELERIGDHCTNIAEQVIYIATGKIVRHMEGRWTTPEEPPA